MQQTITALAVHVGGLDNEQAQALAHSLINQHQGGVQLAHALWDLGLVNSGREGLALVS